MTRLERATVSSSCQALKPSDVSARLRSGEKPRDIFFDAAGTRRAKLIGLEAGVAASSDDRSAEFTISTGALDRYNSTIAADGWRTTNYLKNPVVLWGHDDTIPAIGRAEDVRIVGGKLRSRAVFAERDAHPLADTVYQLIKGRFIGAASVGWIPLKCKFVDRGEQGAGVDYLENELLEWSVVNIPANPECLIEARYFGVNTAPIAAWAEKALDESGRLAIPPAQLEALRKAAGAPVRFASRAFSKGPKVMTRSPDGEAGRREFVAQIQRKHGAAAYGWNSLGEHLRALALEFGPGGVHDRRLIRAPTGAGEIDPSGGGFLVAPQYADELVSFAYEETVIAQHCDRRQTEKPLADLNVPGIDETSRADGSRWGGALAYWAAEAAQVAGTFPRFKNLAFSAKKLIAIITVSNELLNDVPQLEAHVRRVFAAEFGFKLDLAVLEGTGAGQPQGILASSSLISVAKEAAQVAATIIGPNVNKMWKSLPAPSRKTAVWLVNEDAEDQLEQMTIAVGTGGAATPTAAAMYMPAGAGGNEYALLKGRPVLVCEQSPVLGKLGDIVLADLRHYIIIEGEVAPMLSAHVSFINDQAVFRFTLRVDGQSAFASPITAYNGSGQRSPFVALAPR